jgi:lysosomal alpha-glucosidase
MKGPIKNIFRKITNLRGVKTDETQPIDSGFNEQKMSDDTSSVMKETSGAEFNRLNVHCSSTMKLTPDDRKCPRRNVSTFLILLLVILLFIFIPVINLLHFFQLLNSQLPSSEFNRVVTDHSHSNPRNEIVQGNTVVFHNMMRKVEKITQNKSVFSNPVLRPPKSVSFEQCAKIADEFKFDCYPEAGANELLCKARGCCWVPRKKKMWSEESSENNMTQTVPLNVPFCFYPLAYGGYKFINITETPSGLVSFLQRTFKSPYPDDVAVIRMDIRYETEQRLRIKVILL